MKHNFSYVLHTQYSIHVMKSYTITIGKNNRCNKLMRALIRTESVVFVSIMMLCSDHEYEYLNTLCSRMKKRQLLLRLEMMVAMVAINNQPVCFPNPTNMIGCTWQLEGKEGGRETERDMNRGERDITESMWD